MNYKEYAEKVESVVNNIRTELNINGENRDIPEKNIKPDQKKKIQQIINNSTISRSLVCKILGISHQNIYSSNESAKSIANGIN